MPWVSFAKVLRVTVESYSSYPLWFADSKKLPLFGLILMAALLSCVPNSSNKQTKKHNFESYTSPQPASIAYVAPNLGAPPSRAAPLSRLLEPAKLIPVTVAPDPLLKTRRGYALGVGAAGQCTWLGTWKAVHSQGSVAGPPLQALGLAYLGMQALWFVGEDVGSLPAAGGKVQDGSSCCYVGVFAALTIAVRAGTARALCVGACTRQSIRKFPWIWKMLRCWKEIWLAIACTWCRSLNRFVLKI